ncbi:MAG: 6-carboxytetrahydropterin synthase [Sedimentisphaerales bacterium]|nr:6-carboxytetrahydropterin synthase [Sedimentisphaerales bacterium]
MYHVACEIRFRAGHYLQGPDHAERLHVHSWRLRAVVEAERLDEDGLVMDFDRLEEHLRRIVAPLEQARSLNDLDAFAGRNPSTERLARHVFDQLSREIDEPLRLREVTVWERPGCSGQYRR